MALILAVDPERAHKEALERLARDVKGHDLVTATSLAEARALIDRQVPAVVLLPMLLPENEEQALVSHLRSRPGAADVRTLTIPLVADWDDEMGRLSFADLVRQHIRPPSSEPSDPEAERRERIRVAAQHAASLIRSRRRSPGDSDPPPARQAASGATASAAAAPARVEQPTAREGARPKEAPRSRSAAPFKSAPDIAPAASRPMEPVSPIAASRAPAAVAAVRPDAPKGVAARPPAAPASPATRAERPLFAEFEADPTPRESLVSRLSERVRSAGVPAGRWLVRGALAALVIAAGVEGRSYWVSAVEAARTGEVVIQSVPEESWVDIDGKRAGMTPLVLRLPVGAHTVQFKARDTVRAQQITVTRTGQTVARFDWNRKPTGSLQVNSTPPGAHVVLDGKDRGVTPLTIDEVTAGQHAVELQAPDGVVQRTVTVKADQTAQLSETILDGWVAVYSPFELTITDGSRAVHLDDRSQLMLTAGPHDLHFVNRTLAYAETRHIDVQPGAMTTISIVPPKSTLSVTTSEPATVWVDGGFVGETPVTDFPVDLGARNIVVKSAGGTERRATVTVTTRPASLDVDFSKPAS